MDPRVKVDSMVFQDHMNVHKPNLKSNPIENMVSSRHTVKPLPSMPHAYLFNDILDSPTSTLNDV